MKSIKIQKINIVFIIIFLIILYASFIKATSFPGSVLTEYSHTAGQSNGIAQDETLAQGFTIGVVSSSVNVNISGIQLNLSNDGSTGGVFNVSIFNVSDATSVTPIGDPMTYNISIPETLIGGLNVFNLINITLDSAILYANQPYIIYIVGVSGGTDSYSMARSLTDVYAGGRFSKNGGSSTSDAWFEIWGDEIPVASLDVNLSYPLNDSIFPTTNITFNATLTPSYLNLTNATIFVWNSTGSIFNQTTNLITGEVANISTWTISEFLNGEYTWNVYGCGNDSIGNVICNWEDSNWSFIRAPFDVENEEYNNFVFETDNETFLINISTLSNIFSTSIKLNYEGERYFTETNCVEGFCELEQTIDIPLVGEGNVTENKTFFWELTLFGSDGQKYEFNTTSHQQNVSRILLESGGGLTNTTLNFTIWDEQNRTQISLMSFKSTFNFWLGNGTVKRNNSFEISSANSVPLSINPENKTFKTDAIIEYDVISSLNGTYNQRNYHFQNAVLTNSTQNIKLFLLKKIDSVSFIQRVVDTSQIAQIGVLIFQQRYYPETNEYETVSITKTDNSGQSVGFYQTEIPEYRHIIAVNGITLKITQKGKVFPEFVPYTILFTIGEKLDTAWQSFEEISNLVSSLEFNQTTNIITYQWVDSTGSLTIANLTVEKIYSDQSNINVCSSSSELTAGILTCNLTGQNGTFIAKGYIGRSPQVLDKLIDVTISSLKELLAQPFLLLWIILLIAVIGMSLFYPPAGIILTIVVFALGVFLGIVGVGWLFVWAMIALGALILWETK